MENLIEDKNNLKTLTFIKKESFEKIKTYTVYYYQITILKEKNALINDENLYYGSDYLQNLRFPSIKGIKQKLTSYLSKNYQLINQNSEIANLWSFKNSFKYINDYVIENYTEMNFKFIENLSLYIWFNLLQIQKLAPLLLDENINEIYLLPNNSNVVLDHKLFGRINYLYSCSSSEVLNILQRMARENNKDLTMIQPSFKGEYIFKPYFSIRITGDIQPYSFEGATGNIRKLRTNPFNLSDLVLNGTLPINLANFLTYLVSQMVNITIIGPPNSGKTTFQTALLNLMPKHWRVISFEQTMEYISINDNHPHIIRYKYPKYQGSNNKMDIFTQISQLLHRSPDFVNLGEITNEEEAFAWYQVLSAGIPSIQTLHASGMHSILGRIKNVLKIPTELLAASFPHILIFIDKIWIKKRIVRKILFVGELILESNQEILINPVFKYNPSESLLEQVVEFKNLNIWDFLQTKPKASHLEFLNGFCNIL